MRGGRVIKDVILSDGERDGERGEEWLGGVERRLDFLRDHREERPSRPDTRVILFRLILFFRDQWLINCFSILREPSLTFKYDIIEF